MKDFSLLQPLWLLLLPAYFFWRSRQKKPLSWPVLFPAPALRYPLLESIDPNAQESGNFTTNASIRFSLSIMLFVIALTQPVRYTTPIETAPAAAPFDIVLVVGTAISMRLLDYEKDNMPLSRMDVVRRFLDGFARDFSGEKMGLVVLGNPPAVWLPLTTDRRAVRDAVARLRPVLGGRLADMGAALKLVQTQYASDREKIIVMVTDGGLQLGEVAPEVAARDLAESNNTLYVLGVGGVEGSSVYREPGDLIYQSLNLAFLQGIAEAGGGDFFQIKRADAFDDALKLIEARHPKSGEENAAPRLQQSLSPLFIGLGMMLLLLSFAGGTGMLRRRRRSS